jgi:predicted membrane protein
MENKNKRNVVIVIVIVLLVSLVILNNFNMLGPAVVYYLLSWKTLLIVIGLALMLIPKHLAGGIILTSLGVIFWIPALFNNQFQLGEVFLPAFLIVLGVLLLLRVGVNKKNKKHPEKIRRYEEPKSTQASKQDA